MITSSTKLYCIFGNPVEHSLSPVIQNAAFRAVNLDAVYLAFAPSDIGSAVKAMKSLNICGASITIPYKVDIIPRLDRIDGLAEKIGSVNTVNYSNGTISGFNTDGIGASRALKNAGFTSMGSEILILGNGGSSRAIACTLLEEGSSVTIAGRNMDNVFTLVEDLKKYHNNTRGLHINSVTGEYLKDIDAIINATPVGMLPDFSGSPIPPGLLSEKHFVFDIVYKPDITAFLKDAISTGCKTVKGIEMLIYQGARQFEIWTGLDAPLDIMRSALAEKIGDKFD